MGFADTPTLGNVGAHRQRFRFRLTLYRPNMESGIRPPVDSSVSLLGAATYWSTGRLEMRSSASAIRDNSYCHRHDENHNRQKLFPACDGDRTAKEMIDMIREQFFLPAGAIVDN